MQLNPATLFLKENSRPEILIDQPDTDGAVREKPDKEHGVILCRACGRAITHERDRLAVQSSHRHTFANPHGLVFEIGCFKKAPGCAYHGALSAEFTWFAGYQWTIALCAGCLTHLGWLFVSSGSRFNGLILERLVSEA